VFLVRNICLNYLFTVECLRKQMSLEYACRVCNHLDAHCSLVLWPLRCSFAMTWDLCHTSLWPQISFIQEWKSYIKCMAKGMAIMGIINRWLQQGLLTVAAWNLGCSYHGEGHTRGGHTPSFFSKRRCNSTIWRTLQATNDKDSTAALYRTRLLVPIATARSQ